MMKHIPFLILLFAKYRVLTVPQLLSLGASRYKKVRLYAHLRQLQDNKLIGRVCHPSKRVFAYCATPELLQMVLGTRAYKYKAIRFQDIEHTFTCAQVMVSLSKYSFVSGTCLEHELSKTELQPFCLDRVPDGIVQITRDGKSYELAVEVETSLKAQDRIEDILSRYKKTFDAKTYLCQGVLFVVPNLSAYSTYKQHIESGSESLSKRLILFANPDLPDLNPKYFGSRLSSPELNRYSPQNSVRTEFNREVRYLPMKSINALISEIAKTPTHRRESVKMVSQENSNEVS